jgi:hypothetical protein
LHQLYADVVRPLDEGDPQGRPEVPRLDLNPHAPAAQLGDGSVHVQDAEPEVVSAEVARAGRRQLLSLSGAPDQKLGAAQFARSWPSEHARVQEYWD